MQVVCTILRLNLMAASEIAQRRKFRCNSLSAVVDG